MYVRVRRGGALGRAWRVDRLAGLPDTRNDGAVVAPVFSVALLEPASYGGSGMKRQRLVGEVCYNIGCSSRGVVETATHCYTKTTID